VQCCNSSATWSRAVAALERGEWCSAAAAPERGAALQRCSKLRKVERRCSATAAPQHALHKKELLALHKKEEEEGDAIAFFFFFFSYNTKKKQMLFVKLRILCSAAPQTNKINTKKKMLTWVLSGSGSSRSKLEARSRSKPAPSSLPLNVSGALALE
jgi:hypothetical protein